MKKLFTIIVSILFLLSPNILKASHYAGADLTYTCLGGNTYLITYSFYRDCSGIAAPTSIPTQFNCTSNSSFNFSVTLAKIPGTGQEITQACSAAPTHCSNGNSYGIQEYVYQGVVTLAPCNSWYIHYSSGARNPISTISNGGNWYNLATLNNFNAPSNSSPTFSNKPIALVCKNQSYHLNNGAIDPDGDSLVYSFYPVMTGSPTSTVTYYSPYTYTNFLASVTPPGITIDSVTGDICFTPNTIQSTVYGVKVQEYRNINGTPTLIGTVYRDLQLKIVSCNNQIPLLSGMDTSLSHTYNSNDTTYRIEACISNGPIEFDINGFDADTLDTTIAGHPELFSISWNNGIPGANFTTYNNGTDSAYAHFFWQPTSADFGNIKCFTATIQDEACPYNGLQTYSYCILVKGMSVSLSSDTTICKGENLTITAQADSSTVNYHWKLDGIPTGTPTNQNYFSLNSANYSIGHHILSIETDNGTANQTCSGFDKMDINIAYLPNIKGTLLDSTICSNLPITYDAGLGNQYKWIDANSNIVNSTRFFTTSTASTYTVIVYGDTNSRCSDSDVFVLNVLPAPPNFNFGPDTTISQNQTLTLSMPQGFSNYIWSTGATTSSIIIDSSYSWINKLTGSINFSNQCYSSDTIYVYIGSVGMEKDSDSPLKIYPNPIQNYLNIELQKAYPESNIEILDLNGKLIIKTKFSGAFYKLKSLNTLPKGVYILHLQNEELNVLLRFVKE